MAQPHVNLRTLNPMQIVQRAMFCQFIKEIGIEKLQALGEKQSMFIVEYKDDNENIESTYDIDWEFCLFQATPYQMDKLLECFQAKEVKVDTGEEVVKSDIVQEDRPKLFIP